MGVASELTRQLWARYTDVTIGDAIETGLMSHVYAFPVCEIKAKAAQKPLAIRKNKI